MAGRLIFKRQSTICLVMRILLNVRMMQAIMCEHAGKESVFLQLDMSQGISASCGALLLVSGLSEA